MKMRASGRAITVKITAAKDGFFGIGEDRADTAADSTYLKKGESYTLFINLPDIAPTLHDNPDFSVRFANKGVWDSLTGYNRVASFIAE